MMDDLRRINDEIKDYQSSVASYNKELIKLYKKRAELLSPFKVGDVIKSIINYDKGTKYKISEVHGRDGYIGKSYYYLIAHRILKDGSLNKESVRIEYTLDTFKLV